MKTDLFLAGEWVDAKHKLRVVNPYTQQECASVSLADKNHLHKAIDEALACRPHFELVSAGQLSEILQQIAVKIHNRKAEFTQLIVMESAKPYVYAEGEVLRAIETFKIAAEECKRLPSELIDLDWTTTPNRKKGRVTYKSSGVVAGISPFNFPLNLVAHKIAPAIATRCPIILKPSSATPLTSLLLAHVISETSLPKGALSILPCSREVGQLLVEDNRISVLSFTGSPDVGWKMKTQSGKKKVVLELGGNAAAIVHEDADISSTVQKLSIGAFAYSGQVCIHTQRIYVHEKIVDQVTTALINSANSLKVGDPSLDTTNFSVMIDEKNALRIEEWLNEAQIAGAQLLCGGNRKGLLVEPTIVKLAKRGMKIYDEEVFGPVVCIQPYSSIEEAIELVNDSRFGLQASLFTNMHSVIETCAERIEVAGLILNDATTFRVDHMPYGGIKDSGFGREGVRYAMLDFLEPRMLVF